MDPLLLFGSTDVLFTILQYLTIRDSGRYGITSRRNYYLVHQYRASIIAEIAVSVSSNPNTTTTENNNTAAAAVATATAAVGCTGRLRTNHRTKTTTKQYQQLSADEVCINAIQQLRTKPNIGIGFCTKNSQLPDIVPRFVPDDTILLCTRSDRIQSSGVINNNIDRNNINGHYTDTTKSSTSNTTTTTTSSCECDSTSSILLATLQQATRIVPFAYPPFGSYSEIQQAAHRCATHLREINTVTTTIINDPPSSSPQQQDYTLFFIFGTYGEESLTNTFVQILQRYFPNATIIGGICCEAYISLPVQDTDYYHYTNPQQLVTNYTAIELIDIYQRLGGNKKSLPSGVSKLVIAQIIFQLLQNKTYIVQHITEGLCGIAMAGNIPVEVVVSRGAVSCTQRRTSTGGGSIIPRPLSSSSSSLSPYYIVKAHYTPAGMRHHNSPPYHYITEIQDRNTNRIYTASELRNLLGPIDYIGINRSDDPNNGTYELTTAYQSDHLYNSFLIILDECEQTNDAIPNNSTNEANSTIASIATTAVTVDDDNDNDTPASSLIGTNIDLFVLDGTATLKDVEERIEYLHEQTANKNLLGALMISCNGRGPHSGYMIQEDMADAVRFTKVFPAVPCLGFYAGGEIGPAALVVSNNDGSKNGTNNTPMARLVNNNNAGVQTFTVVFAVFVVPTPDPYHIQKLDVDESYDNIETFIRTRIHANIK